jgi:hypothetical protein
VPFLCSMVLNMVFQNNIPAGLCKRLLLLLIQIFLLYRNMQLASYILFGGWSGMGMG